MEVHEKAITLVVALIALWVVGGNLFLTEHFLVQAMGVILFFAGFFPIALLGKVLYDEIIK